MPVIHTMSDTRNSYEEVITRGLDCIYERNIRGAILIKARIEHLIRVLAPMPKTLEVTKMIASLFYMKRNLTILINLHYTLNTI